MSTRLFAFLVLLPTALVSACHQSVTLESPEGLVLTYPCSGETPPRPGADERALVREVAIQVVRHAAQTNELDDAVRALIAADAEGRTDDLERLLVSLLCEGRARSLVAPKAERPAWMDAIELGSTAPAFGLPRLSAGYLEGARDSVTLESLRGEVVFLTFAASWCRPCGDEYEELAHLYSDWSASGLQVVGILYNDRPRQHVLDWIGERGATVFPTLVDENGAVGRAYGVHGLPHSVVVGPDGSVIDVGLGWYPGKSDRVIARIARWVPGLEGR